MMTREEIADIRNRMQRGLAVDQQQVMRALDHLQEIVDAAGYDTDDAIHQINEMSDFG